MFFCLLCKAQILQVKVYGNKVLSIKNTPCKKAKISVPSALILRGLRNLLPTTVRFRYAQPITRLPTSWNLVSLRSCFMATLSRISRVHVNRSLMGITPSHISIINTRGKMVRNSCSTSRVVVLIRQEITWRVFIFPHCISTRMQQVSAFLADPGWWQIWCCL